MNSDKTIDKGNSIDNESAAQQWRHLSPLAILFFASRLLVRSLVQFYPVLILIGLFARDWYLIGLLGIGVVAWVALIIAWAYLTYLNFYYIQQDDRFLIKKGVLSKQQIELSFNRIQDITINQPFYFRPFELVILKLDSAGSNDNEIHLAALTRRDADDIKQTIQGHSKPMDDGQPIAHSIDGIDSLPEETMEASGHLISRSLNDIVIYGLTHNRAWLVLAVIFPLWGKLNDSVESRFSNFTGVDISSWIADQSFFILGLIVLAVVMFSWLLLSVLSVVAAIFSLYGYTLSFRSRSYSRQSGFLNRYELQVKRSRIQNIRYSQNILESLIKRFTLSMDGFATESGNKASNVMTGTLFVPSIKHHDFLRLSQHIFDRFTFPDKEDFQRIDPYYMVRFGIQLGMAIIMLFTALSYLYEVNITGWLLWLVPILISLIVLRWWRYGWWVSDEYIILRKGLFSVTYYCFPRFKAQQVVFEQSWFLKRRQLANVEILLASRAITIPFLDENIARAMVNHTVYDSEFASRSWM